MMVESGRRDKFQHLRDAYRDALPQRIMDIRNRWAELRHAGGVTAGGADLHRLVHSIAGSAGTFGFSALGEQARELEELLMEPGRRPLAEQCADIESRLAALQLLAETRDSADHQFAPPAAARQDEESRLLYVIEDDVALAGEIAEQLGRFGWEVQLFHNASEAAAAFRCGPPPAGVVVDLCLAEGKRAGANLMQQVNAALPAPIPHVVISVSWDWHSRLEAARAGAAAYLVKPIDFGVLAERLDAATRRRPIAPHRVLIVEDTAILADYYAEVLRGAGIVVETVTDPAKLPETLAEFEPNLILMDLYMPACSGIEAARVVRQDRKYASVPIVFLSTESVRGLQLAALQIGADEFLQKPIQDAELITAVTLRAERFRDLAALIRQDSMTGLLNSISFKQSLEAEIERSRRARSRVALAMIDIDGFKHVNDSYGHPAGDSVIRTLAALLRRRLRRSDLLGRYGGDEFVVMMPDTGAGDAVHAIEVLREHFAQIHHVGGTDTFSCTFSTGLAELPPAQDVDALIREADAALYEAKRAGRNCIRVR